tara:strand:+ start:3229 stop:3825 length:597 start_codon:yes stop_codon:yes gene_type:complete
MINQLVNIVEFQQLYNILFEVKNLFTFKILKFSSINDFVITNKASENKETNSIIIVNKHNHEYFLNKNPINNKILIFEEFPIKLEKLLDDINIHLIKQEYNAQSSINIKQYTLNLNKRVIINNNEELKLTEREIDIILFLKNCDKPQSINNLQIKVWKYSFNLETHTVETHIYRLRKKVFDKFKDNAFIVSSTDGYTI